MKILVTGGAGFIGSHLVDALITQGHDVTIFDNLDPWVHTKPPDYLHPDAEFVLGDVRDTQAVYTVVSNADVIYHLAATTSIPQSEVTPSQCISTNALGTANILEAMASSQRLILASSRAVYGEGKYICDRCGVPVYPSPRTTMQLRAAIWELACPHCGDAVTPTGTDELSPLRPASIYAISKQMQEDLCLHISRTKSFPLTILRYFNVYGPRQSLNNPYTGILSIFTSRLLRGEIVEVYEDGLESRDFVYVDDVVAATLLDRTGIFNVGTGNPTTVLDVAELLAAKLSGDVRITGAFRIGDIRHCFAPPTDVPATPLSSGIDHLLNWVMR